MGHEDIIELLSKLVALNSVNPGQVAGAGGGKEVATFVASWLEEAVLDVPTEEVADGRYNVIAIAKGRGSGRSLMLNSHMDTVVQGGMKDPFTPRIYGNRLYGRGALDTKSALAVFMLAAARALDMGLRDDVILTAVVDVEYASAGTAAIVKRWRADGAIIGEPTNLEIVIAHKGFVWLEIKTHGVAAHGSRPDLGVDAIIKMGKVLLAIDELADQLTKAKVHPLLGAGSVHASMIY